MVAWNSNVVVFDSTSIDESTRVIEGVASSPIYDKQNELITQDALKKAVDDYMVLPILTVQHREFVAGLVKAVSFDESGRMHIRAQIKNTPDVDRVWELIKKGVLNAFSISGMRTDTSCPIKNPLNTPCVTTGIHLNAITICGDNAINPEAHFDIVKALFGDTDMTDKVEPEVGADKPVNDNEVLKAQEIIDKLIESGYLKKGDDTKEEEEKKEDDEKEDVKKALSLIEEQTKTISELSKALTEMSEKVAGLETDIKAINETPIHKSTGFTVVDGKVVEVSLTDNPITKASVPSYKDAWAKMRIE